ncbi:cytochrome P450 [Krasilnikovia sp. MM14-A1004]|uniref:cytochrome P450 n=1 Tax=Krasilnikovia sp. MM14-A1004 TaxID=3373541 RepID=UPI00399D18C2
MSETDGMVRGGGSVNRFLPRRMWGWVARRLAARAFAARMDLSDLSRLPDSMLWPLRRDGLDPVAELSRCREHERVSPLPLPFGVRAWLVTGHDEVKTVLGHVDGFSNDFANLAGSTGIGARHDPGGLGFADPPVHTRLRRLLAPEFTMRRLRRLAPRIQAIVDGVLDAIEPSDAPVDLWRSFALPIPSLTICELLGVPYDEREHFQRLATARFDLTGAAGGSLGAISESLSYLNDLVARQRHAPGDGLLGMLVREHGDAIDDRELAGLADGLLTGGLETTASMLALGALVIAREPRLKRLLADDHPDAGSGQATAPFVEELLRYLSVVQVAFPRCAIRDIQLGDVRIAAGDLVACSLSAANRAGVFGADPDVFDPARPAHPHLAFGYGAHRCIGAELARMELQAAYPALVRRFPRLRLAVDPGGLEFRDASIVFGLQALPVLVT